ncbi:MAG: potassium-transporting ATPase subunit C [Candidatus Eremiobacteraeota bacterium]|nr:potassium-transporting ATPase subunit C [Candidatus Eremiobacteraeota bacterium]
MWMIAVRQVLLWTLVCGLLYPLLVTGLSQSISGQAVVGQAVEGKAYFWPRPSAVGYNPAASSGSNFGPHEPRRELQTDRFPKDAPADLRYSSGSGLDPDITPEGAFYQVPRVAAARGLAPARLDELVRAHVQPRTFGVLGHERVNVAELNQALDGLK